MLTINELWFPKPGTSKSLKLFDDLLLEQWIVPKGEVVELHTTRNFGIVQLPVGARAKNGDVIPRTLFRF